MKLKVISSSEPVRLAIVQYAGDFREAYNRLSEGGEETYRAQQFSVDYVVGLAQRYEAVATITALTEERYECVLPGGAWAIGAGLREVGDGSSLCETLESLQPNRLILRTPLPALLRWAKRRACPTMALLADSFRQGGVLRWLRQRRVAAALNDPIVEVIANHGLQAARDIQRIGVDANRVIPWDWPIQAPDPQPKDFPESLSPLKLFFAGAVTTSKGVTDVVSAVGILARRGVNVQLEIAGPGNLEMVHRAAEQAAVSGSVKLLGLISNRAIIERMRAAHAVIVPSRHDYPEGLPLTIYEALAARTPIIASDHPMFAFALSHRQSALIFQAGNSAALAAALEELMSNPALYERLSRGSGHALDRLRLPVVWDCLIDRWLARDQAWLSRHSLASNLYNEAEVPLPA